MKRILYHIIIASLIFSFSSCKKYLDVSDELAGGLTSISEIFDNPSYAKRFYGNIFTGIPDYSNMIRADWDGGGQTGLHNPWTGLTDEISTAYGDNARYLISPKNSSNMGFHRWSTLYTLIRQANLFIEHARVIPPSGTDAEQLDQQELDRMMANVLFMRAYYHYLLFEQYGPIIIMDRAYGDTEDVDLPRNSVDEVVDFIDSELANAIDLLEPTPY